MPTTTTATINGRRRTFAHSTIDIRIGIVDVVTGKRPTERTIKALIEADDAATVCVASSSPEGLWGCECPECVRIAAMADALD